MFNQPAETSATEGGYFKPANHDGNLILFESVIAEGREFDQMANAEREYRVVSYIDLDGDCTPRQGKVTNIGLVKKLPVNGTNILGRISKVKTASGYNAWVLEPYKPEDAAQAKAWIDGGRKPQADPFAGGEADAAGVTPQMLAQLKRLGMIKDDTVPF